MGYSLTLSLPGLDSEILKAIIVSHSDRFGPMHACTNAHLQARCVLINLRVLLQALIKFISIIEKTFAPTKIGIIAFIGKFTPLH